jgi:hypothetical protein
MLRRRRPPLAGAAADRAALGIELDNLDHVPSADAPIVDRYRVHSGICIDQFELQRRFRAADPGAQYGRIAALPRNTPVGENPRSTISGERISKSSV